jgi:hypothetical protein
MKHRDWLRLNKEGEHICAALRQQDYQCCKQVRRLSRKVIKENNSYVLTWLPPPLSDWNLLPNDINPVREKIWAVVQSALAPKPEQVATQTRVQQYEFLL